MQRKRCRDVLLRVASNDGCLLAVLLSVAAAAGLFHLYVLPDVLNAPSSLKTPAGEFSPNLVTSAMIATGRGFVEPLDGDDSTAQYPQSPALTRFLRHETMSLSPAQIPQDFRTCQPRGNWAYRHRLLFFTIGGLWAVFGMSWHVVTGFLIALYCAMVGAIYGLMRLGMGRFWSAAGALFLTVVPVMLESTSNVRDFSKGPFILVAMLAIGHLVKQRVRRAAFFGLATLLGLVVGVGVGFRADVLICLPPALFAVACCRRPGGGAAVAERLAAVTLLSLSFLAPASLTMGVYSGGNLFAHDALMGMATKCDDLLGTNRASYEKLYVNHDRLVDALASSFSERALSPGEFRKNAIDERPLLIRLARTFPGDLLTRVYSSVLWVARDGVPSLWFGAFMFLCAAAVLLIIAYQDPRMAWMTLALYMYFSGYLSLQPESRHAFHLLFVPFWILGFLLDRLLPAFWQASNAAAWRRLPRLTASPRQWWTPSVRGMLCFALPALTLLAAPLYAARACQDAAVGSLLDAYSTAELEAIAVEARPTKGWTMFNCLTRVPPHSGLASPSRPYNVEYWVAEFAPGTQWRPIWLQYATGNESFLDDWLSHGLWVAPSGKNDSGNMKYFFPVVELTDISQRGWGLFAGIAVPENQAGDFRGLYKVRNDQSFPLLLNLSLPADQSAFLRCQTLYGETSTSLDANVARYWLNPMPLFSIPPANGVAGGGGPSGAVQVYQDGLAADPHNALLRLGLAVCLESGTDRETALAAYREALAVDPDFFVTYHYLDAFFKRCGDQAGRIALWKETARNYPDNYLPLFHLALALEADRDFDGAIDAYRKVLELSPSDAETLKDLGRLLVGRDDINSGIAAYERALRIDPHDEQTADSLSGLLARREHK